jgi:hypothetical protein
MKTFNIKCVTLEDFVDTHELDLLDVDDLLMHSKYSYGTNDDTLIGYETLCDMCGTRPLSTYRGIDLMVALGS